MARLSLKDVKSDDRRCLLVVSVVERGVCDAHVRSYIVAMSVFAVAVEQRECCKEIPLFQEVICIRQL